MIILTRSSERNFNPMRLNCNLLIKHFIAQVMKAKALRSEIKVNRCILDTSKLNLIFCVTGDGSEGQEEASLQEDYAEGGQES